MARYFANTNSITQMQATGTLPTDRFTKIAECLAAHAFQSIEETTDELSIGWTRSDNIDEATFEAPIAFLRDNYALFTLRIDKRVVATAVLNSQVSREEKKFLAQNPNLRRTPKHKREEIKEQVKLRLLAKTQAVPSYIDVAWDLNTGLVNVFSTSASAIEKFESLFRKTFEGFGLTVVHPFARAAKLVDGQLHDSLNALNQANSDAVTALIRDNKWLGHDFLLWLLYRGLNASEFTVNTPGHSDIGEDFSAWVDDRIVMQGGGEEGNIQKVAVSGSQDRYREVRSALAMNKNITSGTIYIESGDNTWKLTLDGEMFSFKSCRCPSIRIEKDSTVDQVSEMEAVFFEKMFLLQKGLQYFDSVYTTFLQARLDGGWYIECERIQQWIEDDPQE